MTGSGPPPTGSTLDAFRRDASILAGTDFDDARGHVTAYFAYHGQNGLPGSDRDFSACEAASVNSLTGVPSQGGFTCFGTSNSNRFTDPLGNQYSVELTPGLRPYLEFGFMDDHTLMQIAPSGIFQGQNPLTPDGQYLPKIA